MSSRFIKATVAGAACIATVAALSAFGATAANADPAAFQTVGTAAAADYVAVGSDTIQSLYDGFANGYTNGSSTAVPAVKDASGNKELSSWLATGTNEIVPSNGNVPTGALAIGRPASSGDGRAALSAAWNPASDALALNNANTTGSQSFAVTPGSIDIARSSGWPSKNVVVGTGGAGTQNDNLTSIPLARDAVAVAVDNDSSLTNFTTGELAALYGAGAPSTAAAAGNYNVTAGSWTAGDVLHVDVTGTPGYEEIYTGSTVASPTPPVSGFTQVRVLLPFNTGSGTRKFFLGALEAGYNSQAPWVVTTESGSQIVENTGTFLNQTDDIAPFSAAQWIAQQNGIAPNTISANTAIAEVNGQVPVTGTAPHLAQGSLFGDTTTEAPTTVGTFYRDVFSVIPSSAAEGSSAYDTALTKLVAVTLPADTATINDFGFEPISFADNQAFWIHSSWENTGTAPAQPTTTAVSATAVSGDNVTLSAAVAAPVGFPAPNTGTVTFYVDNKAVGTAQTPNVSGDASVTTTVTGGSHQYYAVYSGDGAATPAPLTTSTSSTSTLTVAASLSAGTPKISNAKPTVGLKLTASDSGATSGSTLAYTWKSGTKTLGSGSSYTVPAAELGKTITVTVDAYKAGEISAEATSAATKAVAKGAIKVGTVKITGTAKVGQTLASHVSGWTAGVKYSYQWLANGKAVSKGTGSTLKLTTAVKGKKISVKVSAKLTGYNNSAAKTSASTAVVK